MTSVKIKVSVNETLALSVSIPESQQKEAIDIIRSCLQSIGHGNTPSGNKSNDKMTQESSVTTSGKNAAKKATTKGNDKETPGNDDNDTNVVTDHEYIQMLDEIEEKLYEFESHSLTVNTNKLEAIPKSIESAIGAPFVGTKYEDNKMVQKLWFNEFIGSNNGYTIKYCKETPYQCNSLSSDIFDAKSQNANKNILSKWSDYVHIRINLFGSKQYIREFGNIFGKDTGIICFRRNEIGVAIHTNHRFFTPCDKFVQYMEGHYISLERYKQREKEQEKSGGDLINNELKYLALWNGLYYLFNWFDIDENVSSFDTYFYSKYQSNGKKDEEKRAAVKTLLSDYVIDRIGKTGLFGEKEEYTKNILSMLVNNSTNVNGNTGNGNVSAFLDELWDECVQDIHDFDVYLDDKHSGVSAFILNRLLNVIYNALFGANAGSENESEQDRKYKNLYQFLWDYCVCNMCYPRTPELEFNKHESFYILSFFMFKSSVFDFKRITKMIHTPEKSYEGTILHRATQARMIHYCELLLKNKFNPRTLNAFKNDCFEIVDASNYTPLQALFKKYVKDDTKLDDFNLDGDNKEEEEEQQHEAQTSQTEQKSIEAQYVRLRTQKMFAIYFVFIMGCNLDNDKSSNLLDCEPKHEKLNANTDIYCDALYRNFDSLEGLKSSQVFDGKHRKEADKAMSAMVKTTIVMLEKKLPILDDILIICFEFCQLTKNYVLLNQFIDALKNSSRDCLDDSYIVENEKIRNYLWFKEYILSSGVWCLKVNQKMLDSGLEDDKKSNDKLVQSPIMKSPSLGISRSVEAGGGDILLFDFVDEMTENALDIQKEYIWQSVLNEEKAADNSYWHKILDYKSMVNGEIRQDKVSHGVTAELNEADLWYVKTMMSESSDFDLFGASNKQIYLTKLLILNHIMNKQYQKDIKHIFVDKICPALGIECLFAPAPVKLSDRCVVKADTDYGDREYPTAAHIADMIRCSICFNNPEDMYKAMTMFCEMVTAGDGDLGCIVDIARIKNGMSDIKNWKSNAQCGYRDIKFNLIIRENKNKNSRCVIGEIQFLLKWLLKAKKIGHKLYGIKRRAGLINAIAIQQHEYESSFLEYHDHVLQLFESRQYKRFTTEMFLLPSMLLATFDRPKRPTPCTMLNRMCKYEEGTKYSSFLVASLHHFANHMVGPKSGKEFLRSYFSFRNLEDCYEMKLANLDPKSGVAKRLALIMKQDEFSLDVIRRRNIIVFYACNQNAFGYLCLIMSRPNQHEETIRDGFSYEEGGHNVLTKLLIRPHCNKDWLNELLIKGYNEMKKREKLMKKGVIKMDKKWVKKGLDMCKNGFTNDYGFQQLAPNQEWAKIIEQYAQLASIKL